MIRATQHWILPLVCLSVAVAAPSAVVADININFDSDTIGLPPSTTTTQSDPVTKPYAIGAFNPAQESPPTASAGSIVVNNVSGMLKGVVLTTDAGNPNLGALWMDVNGFSLPGQNIHVSFQINVLTAPTNATTQPKDLGMGTAGIVLGMNAYTTNGWAYRFAAAPTKESGGVFAFRSPDNTALIPFFDYVEGTTYDIDIFANYSTGTLDALVDGNQLLTGYAFWTSGAANVQTNELFFHVNGEEDFSNSVALDNISAEIVPESSALTVWSLLGLTFSGGAWLRRRAARAG